MKTCISTRFDRYNIFFDLWLKNYLNYNLDIIIFLDGEVTEIVNKVNELKNLGIKISVIELKNKENIYKIDNIKFFNGIFNILYNDYKYEKIIYIDPDELILVDDINIILNNQDDFLISKGFEIIQYKNEEFYDLNKNFLGQRNFGKWTHEYDKVCVFKKNIFPKSQGRHGYNISHGPSIIEKKYIYLINLREICFLTLLENSEINLKKYATNHKHHSLSSFKEINDRMEKWYYPNSIEIPTDIKKIIIKHSI
jgi:hypothetical protein